MVISEILGLCLPVSNAISSNKQPLYIGVMIFQGFLNIQQTALKNVKAEPQKNILG